MSSVMIRVVLMIRVIETNDGVAAAEDGSSMRYAIMLEPQQGITYAEQLAVAKRAEAAGFEAFFRSDHYESFPGPSNLPTTDAWTVLAGIARETSTIRLGALVSPVTYRLPGPFAKIVTTVDEMSGGRVDVALGTGWHEVEHRRLGIPFPSVAERAEMLEETLAILHGLWEEPDGWSWDGPRWPIVDALFRPKPVQRPHPPLFIGGGGRRTLSLAGREADVVGLAPRVVAGQGPDPASLTFAATVEKIGWVREAAGDRFDDLVFNVYPSVWPITITDHQRPRRPG